MGYIAHFYPGGILSTERKIRLLQDKEGIIVGAKSRNGREGTEYTAVVERTTINGNRDILSIVTEGKEYI